MTDRRAPFLSYSANHEDVMLNRVFGAQGDGFFVDVGAAHPLFENDTRALYDRGWRGINIEPTPTFFRELAQQRPDDLNLNVAISDEPGTLQFHEIVGTGLSTADAGYAAHAAERGFEVVDYAVSARTLRDILHEAGAPGIDVLKVDVEGFELQVMRSNDWDRFRPRLILAEGTIPESPIRRDDGVAQYLAGQGYRHVYFDGLNDYYVEREFSAPEGAFDCPLNVFDHFTPFAQHQLRQANASLASELESLRREREQADAVSREREKVAAAMASEIASLRQERDNGTAYIESLTSELRRLQRVAQTRATDLDRAHAEMIAMRERGQALGVELDAAAMRCLLVERDAQSLMAAKAHSEAEAESLGLQLQDVFASTSWRITRPLRALARPRRTMNIVLGKLR